MPLPYGTADAATPSAPLCLATAHRCWLVCRRHCPRLLHALCCRCCSLACGTCWVPERPASAEGWHAWRRASIVVGDVDG